MVMVGSARYTLLFHKELFVISLSVDLLKS